jgi:hypothetical protein
MAKASKHGRSQGGGCKGCKCTPQPDAVKKNVSKMHKMQQLKHFLLMNYRHTFHASYALKLLYGNIGSKKFFGGETPESPFKVHSSQNSWLRLCLKGTQSAEIELAGQKKTYSVRIRVHIFSGTKRGSYRM